MAFFFFPACATSSPPFVVADAFASVTADALVDGSPTGLVYAAFWPEGANPADDPAAVNAWHGSAADWIDMYDPGLRDDREAAFYYSERCSQRMTEPDEKVYNAENYSIVLTASDASLPYGVSFNFTCNVALYAPDGAPALRDAISWRHNATYEVEFLLKFRHNSYSGHVGSGLFAGATVLVGEKIAGGGITGNDIGPADGLAGVWMTNYANDTAYYESLVGGTINYYYFGLSGGPSVVGYHLGPRFMCLAPTCCEHIICKFSPINWTAGDQNFSHAIIATQNETMPLQFCDWRNKEDGATWLDALSLPYFPEHVDPKTTAEYNNLTYSDWYKVKITVLPVGYIANVNVPARAYNFSFTGPRAGTVFPQTFVGTASNSSGLGVGLYVGRYARICNMTIRRLLPVVTAAAESPDASTTMSESTVPTVDATSTTMQAPNSPLLRNKYLPPDAAGPFFVATMVFFTLTLACSATSAWRAALARQRLREQRNIMLRS